MRGLDEKISQLEMACQQLLQRHSGGLDEHQLLQHLRRPPYGLMPELTLDDSLGLFQSHFLLFHVLYRLRDRLHGEQSAQLHISPLNIRLRPYRQCGEGLEVNDPLREYYLDLGQLDQTGREDVEAMLAGFWQKAAIGVDAKQEALATLELKEPVTLGEVKAQYRRLVMAHHPDRGGEAERMHDLNDALATLQRYYS